MIYNYDGFEEKGNGTDNRYYAVISVQDSNAYFGSASYYNIAHSITKKDKYHPAVIIAAIFAAKELWAALLFNNTY